MPKPGISVPGFATETRQMPRGNLVGPCVDFRRVASSRLPDSSLSYIYPCKDPKRKEIEN